MADLLLSALVRIVVQKSADLLVNRIGEMWGIADQRERLHDKLLAVQAVLTDAEEQGARDDNPAVKSWLAKLKSTAYDADDILDEFHYEELRRDAVKRSHKVGKVSDIFSLENPILFRFKMSRKLKEVVRRIDELVTEMERFKFVQGRQERIVDRDRTTYSYVDESVVEGRGQDKEKLVKLLTEVSPTENLMVLPVVGMGGLGKTTLAQLVYNDHRVKKHFKLLIWVCVSEKFDVTKLINDIVVQLDPNVPRDNIEKLQIHLRQEISKKRYLLVLDDVWNHEQDKWDQLRALLNCGDSGSAIIVTTRSDIVATIMGTVQSTCNLGCLGEEDSWSLFQKRAFSKRVKEHPELVGIGRKLVKNCGGLPLAIKALGSLMSGKDEVCQWRAVLEQSRPIWENKHANDNNGVLSVLRLSYDHLPSYMKQCFAFCAVFPKDYVMEKDKLVQYWMAHGFIPYDGLGDLEMRGRDIFNELAWRSFFQDVEQVCGDKSEHGYRSQTTCKMHDLMHDLAQSVMRDECLSLLEPLQINNNLQCNMRHISLREFPKDINHVIQCYPAARTLITNSRDSSNDVQKIGFVKSNFLRVFDWPQYTLDTMITPGKMKHLRYLHLRNLEVTAIPEAITTLYLLQTLRLSNCFRLFELPKGMRYMMSLRHLYIEGFSRLMCMPPGLGELKWLQTLTYYIVGTSVGNKIGELKTLNLGGKLEVYNLGEVGNAREAREANMVSQQNLDHLALCWGMPNNYSEGVRSNGSEAVVIDLEVLDALKPCNKLKILRIREYRGDKFPVWMTDYQMLENLVELYIIECRRCTNVPPLHRLPLLQILHIKCMDNLRHLCCGVSMSAEGGEDAQITFPALKSFILEEMPNLDCWCEGDVGEKTSLVFPVLSDMSISNCPKLNAIPVTPKLKKMTIKGNNKDGRENNAEETLSFKPWVSLEELTIYGFNRIIPPTNAREGEELSVDVSATALRTLQINSSNFWFSSIQSNSPLWLWKCFTFLEILNIYNCDSLTSWPEEVLSNLNCLRIMKVRDCKNFLQSRSKPPPKMSSRQMLLPKLESLQIEDCPNMVEVPKLPRSLENLIITGSTKLESLPEWLGSLVALKVLRINSCESLNSLPSSIGGLTALERLIINGSKKLESLPEQLGSLVALKELRINASCESFNSLPSSIGDLTALERLDISGCRKLESLPEWLGSLVALKVLRINSCESLNSLPSSIGGLTALETLYISRCRKLESLPEQLGSLVALKDLQIWSCKNLNSLPSSIGGLTALERLHISYCKNLASLPEEMQGLEALKSLQIWDCPKIRILPEGLLQRLRSLDKLQIKCPLLERDFRKHGKYGHLISEIRDVQIFETGRFSKRGDLTHLISSCKISCLSAQL